jgi:phthiodiolone/phenolphthiodiolone dimycocerosates ketoreductase
LWSQEGETPVMPDGWHYAIKWAPFEQTDAEVQRIVDATPLSMARKAFHVGTPAEMAALNAQFVEAGADFVGWLDMTPLALGPAEAPESLRRCAEVSAAIKRQQVVSP